VNITIEIKADDTPEVAEVFTVNLVNVSGMDRLQIGAVRINLVIESQHFLSIFVKLIIIFKMCNIRQCMCAMSCITVDVSQLGLILSPQGSSLHCSSKTYSLQMLHLDTIA